MASDNEIKVVFLNPHGAELIDYLEEGLGGVPVTLTVPADSERESLMALVPEADVLIGWGSDSELLDAAINLRVFINPGTGITQHIENFRNVCEDRGVVLVNGHGNSYAVAQHTVALLLALTNKVIPHHHRMVESVKLQNSQRTLYLKGLTVGFLGYGAINTKVHRFLSGFDLRFAACRRSAWERDTEAFPTELQHFASDQLREFFKVCDVVINALPTTRETRGLVTMEELELLGPRGVLVNVGRAATVNQDDMYAALKKRVIAGAAFDVWWGRQKCGSGADTGRNDPYQYPFHELDNVVMSPHRAADCGGDLRRWDEVIENLKRIQDGRTDYLNVVDLELEY